MINSFTETSLAKKGLLWADSHRRKLWIAKGPHNHRLLAPPDLGQLLGGELPTNRKWVSSPQFFEWINPTRKPTYNWGYNPLEIPGMSHQVSTQFHETWRFPEMGVPPVLIHFNRTFQKINHPFGVPPFYGNPCMAIENRPFIA